MRCPTCEGRGRIPKHSEKLRELAPMLYEERVECPDCRGTGKVLCARCKKLPADPLLGGDEGYLCGPCWLDQRIKEGGEEWRGG